MKTVSKPSLMKVSIVDLFGEKIVKIENSHPVSTNKSNVVNHSINVKDISSFSYAPNDLNDSSEGYSTVKGVFTIFTRNGSRFKFYNHLGGNTYITNTQINATLFKSYEADAMKNFFDSNVKNC